MQNGSHQVSLDAEVSRANCAFCQHNGIAANILKETPAFLIVADHAPLVEGHLLIIPKQHYACYGAVPAELDTELATLKREVQQFFSCFYAPIVFWEHGVFQQTVFHAHLHCFPFGTTEYAPAEDLHSLEVHVQEDIRRWYTMHGHYFYMADTASAFLFAPEMDHYLHIIRDVLWYGVTTRTAQTTWRSQQQRYVEGVSLIQATKRKWQLFQQQGADYVDETSIR